MVSKNTLLCNCPLILCFLVINYTVEAHTHFYTACGINKVYLWCKSVELLVQHYKDEGRRFVFNSTFMVTYI